MSVSFHILNLQHISNVCVCLHDIFVCTVQLLHTSVKYEEGPIRGEEGRVKKWLTDSVKERGSTAEQICTRGLPASLLVCTHKHTHTHTVCLAIHSSALAHTDTHSPATEKSLNQLLTLFIYDSEYFKMRLFNLAPKRWKDKQPQDTEHSVLPS